ncbi:MAG: nucleotidyltransferase domain-containing protein [Alcaligenaceae bacterium]|nr:MAG: nucleotidyltransferase domain-containing protein [Alcaligenaceae bacterium]
MSSIDFLFTSSIQRVLALTLTRPTDSFTLRELLRQADSGRGSTQSQIERLLQAGVLVESPRLGRQRSIKANTDHFLYKELCSILVKTVGLAEPVREALKPFADKIEEAFVFGSVANGTDTERSDVDVMVVGSVSPIDLHQAGADLQGRLGRVVQFNLYEPLEWKELVDNDPVVSQIVKGPTLQVIRRGTTH